MARRRFAFQDLGDGSVAGRDLWTMPQGTKLYQILGVPRTASADEIRRAYRKLARKYHPDVNPGNQEAERRFKELTAAHEVLSDPQRRRAYDEFGEESLRGGFEPEKAREYRRWREARKSSGHPFEREVFHFDLGDLFGVRGHAGRPAPTRGADVHAVVELELAQAIRGTEVALSIPSGPAPQTLTVRIPPGADDGSILRIPGRGVPGASGGPPGDLVIETRVKPHPLIRRDGLDLTMRLPVTLDEAYSGGTVRVPTFDGTIQLKIPTGSQSGSRLRVRGKGVRRGGRRGDLYVELDVRLPEQHDPKLADALKAARDAYARPVRQALRL